MGAKKTEEGHVRSLIQNNSGSYSITLPIDIVRKLKWQKNQRVVVSLNGQTIKIVDWPKN